MEVVLGRSMRFASTLGFNPLCATRNFLESVRFARCTDPRCWKLKLTEIYPRYRNLSCNQVPFFNRVITRELPYKYNIYGNGISVARYCDNKQTAKNASQYSDATKKVSVFAKMKQMTKDYWHILIPVHVVTSIGWVAIFYGALKNGVDIAKLMEMMNFSEKYLDVVRNSSAGTWALTYALYKIFTPLRYTVTIGLTTMAIRHFSRTGLAKPLSFGKQTQVIQKTTKSNETLATHKGQLKTERQTEPPKT